MKTAILIIARLQSSRLPRKQLLPILRDKSTMQLLIDRIVVEFNPKQNPDIQFAIATSDLQENREFEKFAEANPLSVYYGVEENLPQRMVEAAEFFNCETFIPVEADDLLCSKEAMRACFEGLQKGSNGVKVEGLPIGMNVDGYRTAFVREAIGKYFGKSLEMDWRRVFDRESLEMVSMHAECARDFDPMALRFTLDYDLDLEFFRKVCAEFGDRIVDADYEEITAAVLEKRLFEINAPVIETYWDNIKNLVAEEDKSINTN